LSAGGEGGDNSPLVGDVGFNVFVPTSLPTKPIFATVKDLKAAVLYLKKKKGAKPLAGEYRQTRYEK